MHCFFSHYCEYLGLQYCSRSKDSEYLCRQYCNALSTRSTKTTGYSEHTRRTCAIMGGLNLFQTKKNKTWSCQTEDFVATHRCKLGVIPLIVIVRSSVLRCLVCVGFQERSRNIHSFCTQRIRHLPVMLAIRKIAAAEFTVYSLKVLPQGQERSNPGLMLGFTLPSLS